MGFSRDIQSLLERLRGSVGASVWRRLVGGLEKAAEKGDPSAVYHEVSKLSRDYFGSNLRLEFPGYFKEYRGVECTPLPKPLASSGADVLEAIRSRRSRREYGSEPLTLDELSTILFHTNGVVGRAWWGGPKRPYPSAGARQPVEVYVSVKNVKGLGQGLYHYNARRHCIESLSPGDHSKRLSSIALDQDHVEEAPAVLILTAVYPRTGSKYGNRSYRYVHWDVGFAGENVYLTCEALGLATVAVGAFYDDELCGFLGIDCEEEIPMLLFPVGRRP